MDDEACSAIGISSHALELPRRVRMKRWPMTCMWGLEVRSMRGDERDGKGVSVLTVAVRGAVAAPSAQARAREALRDMATWRVSDGVEALTAPGVMAWTEPLCEEVRE